MSLLYLTGKHANLLKRATVTTSPAALAAYPLANLSDGDPSTPMVLGSLASYSYVQAILNPLTNPSFESALATGWTDGSVAGGSATRVNTAGHVNSGTYGCDLVAADAAHPGVIYQSIEVSAGEYRELGIFAKTISGTPVLQYEIYNETTKKYWNGTAWTSVLSRGSFTGTLSGSFSFLYARYQVEDFSTCGADTVMMRVSFYNESVAASTVAVDDAQDVPGVNFCAIIGHNLGGVSVAVQYDASGAWSGGEATAIAPTIQRGAFFGTGTMTYTSPWRVSVVGTNWDEPYYGEVVLGQYQTCATSPKWGFSTERNMPGVRGRGPSSRPYAYNLAVDQSRDIEMSFTPRTEAEAAEIENMVLRSGQGRYPTIIVPIDTEAGVFYGRLQEPVIRERPFMGVHEIGLKLLGDPLPVIGA